MNETLGPDTCTVVTATGPCSRPPTLSRPIPLCDEHKVEVALAVIPDVLGGTLARIQAQRWTADPTLPDAVAHIIDSAPSTGMPDTEHHGALVYFVANGGRVKIGHTRRLYARIQSLSLREDAVLLLLSGGASLERALHHKFATHRVGDSEWFDLGSDVVRFIAEKSPLAKPRSPRRSRQSSLAVRGSIDEARLTAAREIALGIINEGSTRISRRALKAAGLAGKTATLQEIADQLNNEISTGKLTHHEATESP
ncbi:GIY-YIG nuclease family protein [Streptomyces avidinii]|uniref:GIY-YIG nuclease family protein n=1 Tax=Streptomyces avidinii TaxID=1895 RepID=UPI00379E3989